LEAIADICAAEDRGAKAVRLYGAASTQREALGLAFPPAEKISYQKGLDRLHQLVPDKQFETEWAAGRALAAQAAINFALQSEATTKRSPRRKP
jgi:hypothetical protein